MKRTLRVCLLVFGLMLSWALAYAEDSFYVIPFKKCCTCQGTLYANRWCDNGDGTVTDLTTCLVWLKYASCESCADGIFDWGHKIPWRSDTPGDYDDANTQAGILHDGSILEHSVPWDPVYLTDGSVEGDWRLPTRTELYGLVNGTPLLRCDTPGPCDLYAFKGV